MLEHTGTEQFFIQHPMLEVIVVVSNQGTVHYLKRDKDFDYDKVAVLFRDDESQLQKSIQKSKEMMAVVEEYKQKRALSN